MRGWKKSTLGELCKIIPGQSPKGSNYNGLGEGLPFYQGKKEFGEKCLGAPVKWTTQITCEAIAGDILMSVRAPVGPINFATERICIGRGLAAIRVGKQIHREFLFYLLLSMQDDIKGSKGAIFSSINKEQIESIRFSKPPLPEQKRIVATLDKTFTAIETAITNTKKNLANVRELFSSILDRIFQYSEFAEGLGSYCNEGWIETTLGDLCMFRRGLTYKKGDEVPTSKNAVLRANNITVETGEINFDEIRFISDKIEIPKSKRVSPGSLLICTASGSKKHLGKIGLIEDNLNYAFGGFMGLLVPSDQVLPKYLFWLTRSDSYRDFINTLSDGVNINNLKWSQLSRFSVPLPPIPEQKQIVATLDKLSAEKQSLVRIYETKASALAELKQSILHKAFAGELTADRVLSDAGI